MITFFNTDKISTMFVSLITLITLSFIINPEKIILELYISKFRNPCYFYVLPSRHTTPTKNMHLQL